ncbi:sulfatase family protein [Tuwongella immobilis]|uniref:N-sulphoglucosamine sulphohydrolase C-terminal domain-containing protein n=1 Tax=Tuwongella immobilis TaxID=692036 RepID=A0A6C2YK22_9BACT|nr:sulfatase [Tuwongella immobilis]VIP01579.1 sulfatase : Putative Mucin-desulfating sulfatase (N-acetylglucosamine-6-sulfatase) OS=mine drainage metagenome GN=CARN6_2543 PE=4 SV=1: Sulfatase [Tuwongella immobilis]VTR98827.1 sulfatase : Putative Mucin-desulfating sulfatase (N-acetylglucosamine-6-sulfatase) OS=mine drainage metagenome GN=CARN6_2543 PE=4 SV=1: Sulfatase [Tuwongella immobilis]
MRKLLFSAVLMLVASVGIASAADRPNLLIMMTDDQRADALSCAGNPVLRTPNLDRIAGEGARFRNMFVTNALCAPSRATLLTGLYSHSHGVTDNRGRIVPQSIPMVSDLLRKAGYEVAFCGKSHQGNALRDREWDHYFGYRGQGNYLKPMVAEGTKGKDLPRDGWMDDVITDDAIAWMKQPHEKPFAMFLFFKAPHRSWTPPPRHKDLFNNVTIPLPKLWDADRNAKTQAFAKADNRIGDFADVKDFQSYVKDYYRTIVGVDDNVGKVFAALEANKQLDSTAILFTSDNGFFQGEWKAFDKRFMHEPSIRVPLLMRYPAKIKAGSLIDPMVLNVDIAPTLLDLAGLPVPESMQGRSVVPLFAGTPADWRKDWLYEYFEYPAEHNVRKHRGVRTDTHKLIHYYESPEEWELYDLSKDPDELHNLYRKPGMEALTTQLKQRIVDLRKQTNDRD